MQSEKLVHIVTKPMFNILEYGICWNMEYFGTWNILDYRIFRNMKFSGI